MRTWRHEEARKTHPQTFKTGLNHCRQTSIPVWSLWQIIWQNRMETNVFASVLSFCETGWKLYSKDEKPESTSHVSKHTTCEQNLCRVPLWYNALRALCLPVHQHKDAFDFR